MCKHYQIIYLFIEETTMKRYATEHTALKTQKIKAAFKNYGISSQPNAHLLNQAGRSAPINIVHA